MNASQGVHEPHPKIQSNLSILLSMHHGVSGSCDLHKVCLTLVPWSRDMHVYHLLQLNISYLCASHITHGYYVCYFTIEKKVSNNRTYMFLLSIVCMA